MLLLFAKDSNLVRYRQPRDKRTNHLSHWLTRQAPRWVMVWKAAAAQPPRSVRSANHLGLAGAKGARQDREAPGSGPGDVLIEGRGQRGVRLRPDKEVTRCDLWAKSKKPW
jgi:hypothetical protein